MLKECSERMEKSGIRMIECRVVDDLVLVPCILKYLTYLKVSVRIYFTLSRSKVTWEQSMFEPHLRFDWPHSSVRALALALARALRQLQQSTKSSLALLCLFCRQ